MGTQRKPIYVECVCPVCGRLYFDWIRHARQKQLSKGRFVIQCGECLQRIGVKKRREVSERHRQPGIFDRLSERKGE